MLESCHVAIPAQINAWMNRVVNAMDYSYFNCMGEEMGSHSERNSFKKDSWRWKMAMG